MLYVYNVTLNVLNGCFNMEGNYINSITQNSKTKVVMQCSFSSISFFINIVHVIIIKVL